MFHFCRPNGIIDLPQRQRRNCTMGHESVRKWVADLILVSKHNRPHQPGLLIAELHRSLTSYDQASVALERRS